MNTYTVLDTAAGVWLDRHGMVTSTRNSNSKGGQSQPEDSSLELMRRGRHAAASVGGRVYVYGGLRGGKFPKIPFPHQACRMCLLLLLHNIKLFHV